MYMYIHSDYCTACNLHVFTSIFLDSLAFCYQFSCSSLSPLRICDNNSGEIQHYYYIYMYIYKCILVD